MKKLFLVIAFLIVSLTHAQAQQVLNVGTYSFPPYFTVGNDGKLGGIWKELLDQKLQALNLKPVYTAFPPPRLAQNIIQGRTDLTISAHHVAVDNFVYYSQRPVSTITLNAYHKADRPKINSLEDLRGKSVILIRGYAYDGRIHFLRDPENKITIVDAVTHKEAVRRLNKGNADYLLDYALPVKNAIEHNKIDAKMILADQISIYSTYFVVSHFTENAKNIIKALNDSLPPQPCQGSDCERASRY